MKEKIKVIMIGPLSIGHVRDSWVVPMRELFDTTFIDVSPILSVYRNIDFVEKYIYALLRKYNYDYMFFYSDIINNDFSDDFFQSVRLSGVPIINFLADDEPEIWFKQNLPYDHRFDLVATHSKKGYHRRLDMGKEGNFMYLPWGFNENLFNREPDLKQDYDVIHIGSNLCQENDPNIYFLDGYQRQKMLVEAYHFCLQNGYSFKVFGAGWHLHPILKNCNGGLLSNEEMVKLYGRAKVVLNPGFSADSDEGIYYQTKLRHFEAAGCGAFQLVNYNPELAEFFKPDEDIVYYQDTQNLKDKLSYYLENEAQRRRIADNIYLKRELHTTTRRLKELFNKAMILFPPHTNDYRPAFRNAKIKTLVYKNPQEAIKALRITNKQPDLLEGHEFIHIITGDFYINNLEYSTLKVPIIAEENLPTAVRTYLQLASLHHNLNRRNKQNMIGVMLNERVCICELKPWLKDYLKKNCLLLEDSEYFYPIMNLIIPVVQIEKFIDIYLAQDLSAFKKLKINNSGLVVSDLSLKPGIAPESISKPPYIIKLQALLDSNIDLGERILVYGAKGYMSDNVIALLQSKQDIELIGFIDRTLAGQIVQNLPVYSPEDIEKMRPTMIIIAAETSGVEIYKSISQLETRVALIPLHDLTDSTWQVLLAE